VLTAVKGGDATEISGAMAKFTDLTADSDDLADGLDATKCVGLGQAAMAAVSATPPSTTTVSETTLVVVTTTPTDATTLPPVTLPPTTVPPITTVPVTAPPTTVPPVTAPPVTTPPATTAPGATADGNMIDNWTAPPGFEFQRDAGDILVAIWPSPKFDPVIGPTFVRYDVGALGGPSATTFPIIMALELSEKFTDEQIDAYITFEGNDAGSTVDSPGGYTMWVVPASGDITFDSTMVFLGKYAINMRTDPGVDAVGILDTFIEANFD